jgi:hypothetical protein
LQGKGNVILSTTAMFAKEFDVGVEVHGFRFLFNYRLYRFNGLLSERNFKDASVK